MTDRQWRDATALAIRQWHKCDGHDDYCTGTNSIARTRAHAIDQTMLSILSEFLQECHGLGRWGGARRLDNRKFWWWSH